MKYPQNLRNISRAKLPLSLQVLSEHGTKSVFGGLARTIVICAILSSATLLVYSSRFSQKPPEVLGTETSETTVDAWQEIEKTRAIIEKRPDYAAAWLRLAVLYEQIGDSELANRARETAKKLNPDLASD